MKCFGSEKVPNRNSKHQEESATRGIFLPWNSISSHQSNSDENVCVKRMSATIRSTNACWFIAFSLTPTVYPLHSDLDSIERWLSCQAWWSSIQGVCVCVQICSVPILLPLVRRGGRVGTGFYRPDPIKTLRQTNAAHMVMCSRQASRGLQRILRQSRPSDLRRALKTDSLLEKGVECNSWIMDSLALSFTALLVSLFSFVFSAPVNLLPTTRQKPDMTSFQFMFQSFLFCLYTRTPTQPSRPLRMLKCPGSPINLPGDRSWDWRSEVIVSSLVFFLSHLLPLCLSHDFPHRSTFSCSATDLTPVKHLYKSTGRLHQTRFYRSTIAPLIVHPHSL